MVKPLPEYSCFRNALLLVFFFVISNNVLSQCPDDTVYLNTQAKIDQFVALYPNCTEILAPNGLDIGHPNGNTNITDLSVLAQITSVGGFVSVYGNPDLTSLNGLQNIVFQPGSYLSIANNIQLLSLQDAGSATSNDFGISVRNVPLISDFSSLPDFSVLRNFSLYQADSFLNLAGLENITAITDRIEIYSNAQLTSLDGLQIAFSETTDNSRIYIHDNPQLQSIDGILNSATGIFSVSVSNNPNLNSLVGLEPLTVARSLEIINNDALQNLIGLNGLVECRNFILGDNDQLVDITGFQQVEFINLSFNADFTISNNASLTSIAGMTTGTGGLKSVLIESNPQLQNLDGLEGVADVQYDFELTNNAALEDVNGLTNIESFRSSLNIQNNPSLINIDGISNCILLKGSLLLKNNIYLQNLSGLANIQNDTSFNREYIIEGNSQLSDISGLATFEFTSLTPSSVISFQNNIVLSNCSIESVCNFMASDSQAEITIMNNAPGCNNEPEVILECGLDINIISGEVSFDFNNNGCDLTDPFAHNILIETTDGTSTYGAFTNVEGFYQNFVESDGSVTTSVVAGSLPPFYTATPAIITVFSGFGNEETVDFCLTATEDIDNVKVTIVPTTVARAGFNAGYQLIYENIGTTIANGQVSLQFDDNRQNFVNATPAPTTVSGGLIEWDYATLQPFEIRTIDVTLFTIAPPVNQPDDELILNAHIDPVTGDVDIENNDAVLKQIIVASYDPNDKQVVQGVEISEEKVGGYLDYIVRFQNTGNAEALQVIVTDTLHTNLDWETLRPLSASHEYTTQIRDGNAVSFTFNSIDLPPEISDPEGSQGFVVFQVKTNNDLVVGDIIENTANIYFDANPPIITNTVQTMVVDVTPPIAICQSIQVVLDESGEATITASDIDGGSSDSNGVSELQIDQNTFDCSNVGENQVILTVIDFYGNQSTCTAMITIVDEIPPIVACINATIFLDETGTASIDPEIFVDFAETFDVCGIGTIESSVETVSCENLGIQTVTVVFTDDSGNTSSCEATLNILDEIPPMFDPETLPENQIRQADTENMYVLEDFTTGILATDNCDMGVNLAQDPALETVLIPGVYTIDLIATDASANEFVDSFQLTVEAFLGADNFVLGNAFILYPNPASEIVNVITSENISLKKIRIYSVLGERLLDTSESTIDISNFSVGIYFVEIITDQGSITKKIVKE